MRLTKKESEILEMGIAYAVDNFNYDGEYSSADIFQEIIQKLQKSK